MSEIIIDKHYQEFWLKHNDHKQIITLPLVHAKRMLESIPDLELYLKVDGWGDVWEVFVDNAGVLRAQCPFSQRVTPVIKYGSIISTSGRIDNEQLKDEIMNIELDERKIPKRAPISSETMEARKPQPPEEMVGALQDRIHIETGVARPAKSHKIFAPSGRQTMFCDTCHEECTYDWKEDVGMNCCSVCGSIVVGE